MLVLLFNNLIKLLIVFFEKIKLINREEIIPQTLIIMAYITQSKYDEQVTLMRMAGKIIAKAEIISTAIERKKYLIGL